MRELELKRRVKFMLRDATDESRGQVVLYIQRQAAKILTEHKKQYDENVVLLGEEKALELWLESIYEWAKAFGFIFEDEKPDAH